METHKSTTFLLGILRIISFLTLAVYILLFIVCLIGWSSWTPAMCGMFGFMLVLSLIAVVGIMGGKGWGLVTGYSIAIIHLPVFLVGTVAGLVLLTSLAGATPWFTLSSRDQRRLLRGKR